MHITSAGLSLLLIKAYYYMDLISYFLNIHCIVKIKTHLYNACYFLDVFLLIIGKRTVTILHKIDACVY